MLYIGIVLSCWGFLLLGRVINTDEDESMSLLLLSLGISIIITCIIIDVFEKEERQEQIDKYCTTAVEKGQFTSVEECKYVLEEY